MADSAKTEGLTAVGVELIRHRSIVEHAPTAQARAQAEALARSIREPSSKDVTFSAYARAGAYGAFRIVATSFVGLEDRLPVVNRASPHSGNTAGVPARAGRAVQPALASCWAIRKPSA
jgi:hypothetical protein